ncbi:MAG: glycosyl transferase [Bacteroidetes bacterium]|jgi:hypothetical protein|nr:glycosyl transferase [Bacteroidota bacterium]
MKVSGFTIIRNALKYDYPVVEAITSILPVCDEFIVSVGNSEDETMQLIRSIQSPKIKIVESVWDDSLRVGGKVLADETNKALSHISKDSDWAFYIQSDEVIHEKYHAGIRETMEKWKDHKEVDGLLFNYTHFYGSYNYVGDSRKWYRKEIRIIRNSPDIVSYKDAQGFRKRDNSKLKVKPVDAFVYHYGWVKPPKAQQEKQKNFNKLWHDDTWMKEHIGDAEEFDYSAIDVLAPFTGSHPLVMKERLNRYNWDFNFDPSKIKLSLKDRFLLKLEKATGYRAGEYRNYNLI